MTVMSISRASPKANKLTECDPGPATTMGSSLAIARPPSATRLSAGDANRLLGECYALFEARLLDMATSSLELAHDLFESHSHVPDGEVAAFLNKRGEWLARFPKILKDAFERRIAGHRRKGRRLDADASLSTLRVLTAFDHEKQAALIAATAFIESFTRRERAALDLRVDALLAENLPGEIDNPFSIAYIVDALGATSRAIYPNPRIWRPLLERLLTDTRPVINKLYLSLNRLLADHGVLPEIKAALRARSELRPRDDRDLFGTFAQMLGQPGVAPNVNVPNAEAIAGAPPSLVFADASAAPATAPSTHDAELPVMDDRTILTGLTALAEAASNTEAMKPGKSLTSASGDPGLPSVDPMMALGSSTPLFATLAHWQKLDLSSAIANAAGHPAQSGVTGVVVPLNLIPYIRAAIAGHITNPADGVTMDVIALLFDYIFRDASISESARELFGRLQVPIVKAALLDRTFFSDGNHPARLFLDHLADAAIGTSHHDDYRASFVAMAREVIDDICANFQIDVAVFQNADARLLGFVDAEYEKSTAAASDEVAAARAAEESEGERAAVIAIVRDRLAGLTIPFEVRSFAETAIIEYLTEVRQKHGDEGEEWIGGVATLDEMLWSIVVKERTGQKARLATMVPNLIRALRKVCVGSQVPDDRSKKFFEELYQLHMAAIKPAQAAEAAPGGEAIAPVMNVHDYVNEMVLGTWLTFRFGNELNDARLTYLSPMRTKFVFTGRYFSGAQVFTAEELAYQLATGKARVLMEPVPLWDRAVSSALDTLAARSPPPTTPERQAFCLPA
jgi:hypothetical protein